MTARNSLYIFPILVALAAMVISVSGEDDVTVISTPANTPAPPKKTASTDDPTVIHKSSHKKKKKAVATSTGTSTPTPTATTSPASSPVAATVPEKLTSATTANPPKPAPIAPAPTVTTAASKPSPVPPIPTKPLPAAGVATSKPLPPVVPVPSSPSATPTVETGLPVARYPGVGTPIRGVSTYTAMPMTLPPLAKTGSHSTYLAGTLPVSVLPLTSSAAGSYSSPSHSDSASNFAFTNFPQRPKTTYPWRSGIITTTFWIGEGDTPISRTTNVQSSWDEDWLYNNRGSDSPNNRNGYAAGNHASTLNPFYVALPFNDLAFPDKARRWLPGGWYRRPVDGRQVSACKDRWVEIKNGKGDICYAQWEDVGPLNYSDAEYVFGGERPVGMGDNHAGLDVSPAVAEYLNISDRNRMTSWRFVDDIDVRPGAWLKLDEQAVLYTALHQFKDGRAPTSELPIQRASEPIDESQTDSNKKKVDASKG